MIDPVSAAIIAAAIAGATGGITDVSKAALVDTYGALKAAIQKRFGPEHALVKAVEAVDAKPTSAGADQETELLRLAEPLRQLLKEHARENTAVQQIITGNYNATSVHGDANVTVEPPRDV